MFLNQVIFFENQSTINALPLSPFRLSCVVAQNSRVKVFQHDVPSTPTEECKKPLTQWTEWHKPHFQIHCWWIYFWSHCSKFGHSVKHQCKKIFLSISLFVFVCVSRPAEQTTIQSFQHLLVRPCVSYRFRQQNESINSLTWTKNTPRECFSLTPLSASSSSVQMVSWDLKRRPDITANVLCRGPHDHPINGAIH